MTKSSAGARPTPAGALDAIARFAEMRRASVLVAGWAAAEAIVLPVVPDVALVLFALAAPRRTGTLFAWLLAGAVAGSLVLAVLASVAPARVDHMLRSIPGIDGPMIAAAEASLDEHGVAGFAQFGPGAPLKVYTAAWVEGGGGTAQLILGVVLNRVTRIAPAVVAAAVIGWLVPGWLRRHERLVLVGYGAGWIALYALYLA